MSNCHIRMEEELRDEAIGTLYSFMNSDDPIESFIEGYVLGALTEIERKNERALEDLDLE